MSDQAHVAAERTTRARPKGPAPPEPPMAIVKKSRWPGWIWSVPIAALAIVIYLGVRSITQGGPTVTVVFDQAPGVKADQTKVQYEGSEVGTVTAVKWHKDLQAVNVTLSMNADMAGHLGPGTRYWIAGQNVSLTDLSNLKSVIAGPHLEIEPRPGKTVSHVQGLPEPPVITTHMRGTLYTLTAAKLDSVSRGSQIYYLGLKVGRVLKYDLGAKGRGFVFTVFVQAPYDRFVHGGSRFWNASAVDFSMGASGPSVRLQSVPALLEGAIAFETPSGAEAGPVAKPDAKFTLYPSKNAAENAAPPDGLEYRVQFVNAAVSIPADAPVDLLDKQIGAVRSSTVQYDPATGELVTKALLVLNPADIHTTPGLAILAGATPRQRMNAILADMVAKGLRAQLSKNPPFIGSEQVVLRFDKSAPDPPLGAGPVPEIPSEAGAGGEAGMQGVVNKANDVLDRVSAVLAKLDRIPIAQIGREVHQTTARLARLSRDPDIERSLHRLDRSLAHIERVTNEAQAQVGPILAQVRRATDEAQRAIASAQTTLASAQAMFTGRGARYQNNPNAADIPATLYELSRAARSIRELSGLVDRQPSSLIFGRGKNE